MQSTSFEINKNQPLLWNFPFNGRFSKFHNTLSCSFKILHKHCVQFLLALTIALRQCNLFWSIFCDLKAKTINNYYAFSGPGDTWATVYRYVSHLIQYYNGFSVEFQGFNMVSFWFWKVNQRRCGRSNLEILIAYWVLFKWRKQIHWATRWYFDQEPHIKQDTFVHTS